MQVNVDYQAEVLAAKVKHYLLTAMGRLHEEANSEEFYRALAFALREEIMINWLACARTYAKSDVRMLYYFSMEYLPGRILANNIVNLSASDIVKAVIQKLNRSMGEIVAREPDPGLGNGGLGRLASCFLDSLATHHYPVRAYGLRYQYGIFEQQLWEGMQVEAPDLWLLGENPWEARSDLLKVAVKFCGTPEPASNIHGDEIMMLKGAEEVWALPFDIPIIGYSEDGLFSVAGLRLWSTKESPKNFQLQSYNAGRLDQAAENTLLTDVLYPNDVHEVGKRIRLKQEFLLVSASLQDIIRSYLSNHDNFRSFADKVRIQINDTHPALAIPELIRYLTKNHDIPWRMAVDMTMEVTGYTNHTILSEALEQWDQRLMFYLLPRQYRIIEHLNHEFCNHIRSKYHASEETVRRLSILEQGKVRMANLAIIGSHKVNGVSKLHGEILKKQLFNDFYKLTPEKFLSITNGVTQRRWLLQCNPELANFVTRYIGKEWITDFSKIAKLGNYASNPECQSEFLAIKRNNKVRLINYIEGEYKLRNSCGEPIQLPPLLDPDALFDVQIKRVHEYKRQLLNILHLITLYQEMAANPNHGRIKRVAIIGGKAASSYETAKDIIRLAHCVARKVNRDPMLNGMLKIIYIENYNVSRAEMIIPAADISEQISLAGMEASGTGNMKLTINGALTVGTDDGANIEMSSAVGKEWWPFSFGASSQEIDALRETRSYNSEKQYRANLQLQMAVDTLRDRTFAVNDEEHLIFCDLYHKLIERHYGDLPDRYFTLYDYQSYCEVQKKVEEYFIKPKRWAEIAIHNMAGMGTFSSDRAIGEYADLIWQLKAVPPNDEELSRVRHEFSAIDVCRVYK